MDKQSIVLVVVVVVAILAVSNVFVYVTLSQTKDEYNSLQSSFSDYVDTHHNTDAEFSSLQTLKNDFEDIANLNKVRIYFDHQPVNQQHNDYTYWFFHDIEYAGYMTITIHTSTTTNAYVKVVYNYGGTQWVLQKTLGFSGSAVFPVLPSSSVQVGIGNTNILQSATHDFSVTFRY